MLGIVPVVAEKLTELWPIAMVTLAGTVTKRLLLLSDTTAATMAGFVSDAVHVVDELPPTVDGTQAKELNCGGAAKVNVVGTDTAPALAVTIPVWSAVTSAAVAVKPAVVWPELTVTLAGTVKLALLLLKETANPAPDAA